MRLLNSFILALLAAGSIFASNIWVAETTQGSGDGSSPVNAKSRATFNASFPVAGSTIRLTNIFAGGFILNSSGTVGNPITFHFENGSSITCGTLGNGGSGFYLDGQGYIVIEAANTNTGGVFVTNNGDALGNQHVQYGIYGASSGVHDLTVQNIAIKGLFVRSTNTASIANSLGAYVIGSNNTFTNCYFDGMQGGIVPSYTPGIQHDIRVTHCLLTNYNHAFEMGAGASVNPFAYNVTLDHNRFESGDMYESPNGVDLGLHRNAIFMFDESAAGGFNGGAHTGCISNLVIAYNFIRHGGANPQSKTAGTGAMFFDAYTPYAFKKVRIYNNISTLNYPVSWSGGGGFFGGAGQDVIICNNTALGWTHAGTNAPGIVAAGSTNAIFENNLAINIQGGLQVGNFAPAGYTNNSATRQDIFKGITIDYNVYNGQSGSPWLDVAFFNDGNTLFEETFYASLATFAAAYPALNWEAHSSTNNIALDPNYMPVSAFAIRGPNLVSLGIPAVDYYGNARPALGTWGIGAVESSPVPPPSTNPAPIIVTGRVEFSGTITIYPK